ncbi:hypothetical protein SAMN04490178_14411 [Propionispora vibrioides]|uniref:Uncharacterized protein n=1 Tax=Propionispora vibrioides TaxID=112903 RepID=A0A1H8Y5I2_9FIRM|nr:hypothetical protein SAMN04490178_14411 [Propionispora vibrioides]
MKPQSWIILSRGSIFIPFLYDSEAMYVKVIFIYSSRRSLAIKWQGIFCYEEGLMSKAILNFISQYGNSLLINLGKIMLLKNTYNATNNK